MQPSLDSPSMRLWESVHSAGTLDFRAQPIQSEGFAPLMLTVIHLCNQAPRKSGTFSLECSHIVPSKTKESSGGGIVIGQILGLIFSFSLATWPKSRQQFSVCAQQELNKNNVVLSFSGVAFFDSCYWAHYEERPSHSADCCPSRLQCDKVSLFTQFVGKRRGKTCLYLQPFV